MFLSANILAQFNVGCWYLLLILLVSGSMKRLLYTIPHLHLSLEGMHRSLCYHG